MERVPTQFAPPRLGRSAYDVVQRCPEVQGNATLQPPPGLLSLHTEEAKDESPVDAGETEAADGAGESSAGLATNEASMAQLPPPADARETEAAGDASVRPGQYTWDTNEKQCKQQ